MGRVRDQSVSSIYSSSNEWILADDLLAYKHNMHVDQDTIFNSIQWLMKTINIIVLKKLNYTRILFNMRPNHIQILKIRSQVLWMLLATAPFLSSVFLLTSPSAM